MVVAPIILSDPLARAGLSMLPASVLPSAAPAPTMVWSSSTNRIIWPSDFSTSLMTALSLSSNSPRYFAPANKDPISRFKTNLFFRASGTSPSIIFLAKPSTMAVFPVPGSPTRTGLFFVLLDKI